MSTLLCFFKLKIEKDGKRNLSGENPIYFSIFFKKPQANKNRHCLFCIFNILLLKTIYISNIFSLFSIICYIICLVNKFFWKIWVSLWKCILSEENYATTSRHFSGPYSSCFKARQLLLLIHKHFRRQTQVNIQMSDLLTGIGSIPFIFPETKLRSLQDLHCAGQQLFESLECSIKI